MTAAQWQASLPQAVHEETPPLLHGQRGAGTFTGTDDEACSLTDGANCPGKPGCLALTSENRQRRLSNRCHVTFSADLRPRLKGTTNEKETRMHTNSIFSSPSICRTVAHQATRVERLGHACHHLFHSARRPRQDPRRSQDIASFHPQCIPPVALYWPAFPGAGRPCLSKAALASSD